VPKKPTTTSVRAVVMTEGARIDRVRGVNAPLCASMGEVGAIPLKSRTAPARAALEESDQE
jgi:hypothetical protein